LLLNEAGDASGGGSGTGTLLGGGGATSTNAGNANSGNGNAAGAGTNGNPPAAANATVTIPDNWKMALPKELQDSDTLKPITNIEALAKSYINAQKLVGADKIPVPSKHATDEDWRAVFNKLGLPQDMKEYSVTRPKDATFDDQFVGQFKEAAFKAGVLPKQAQSLVDWFNQANHKVAGEMSTKQAEKVAAEIGSLKTEWGDAFTHKVGHANKILKEFGGKELESYLQETGLANDVRLVKLLSKVGEKYYAEDAIVGAGAASSGPKSPDEAKKSISTVMGDPKHPYHDKAHPGHKTAVEEMATFFGMAYPKKSS
jgi:hypothetical protein